jgi:hypothetical protein
LVVIIFNRFLGPFQRREPASTSPIVPSKPKENPFGNAAPRDEEAIQRQIEERRLAREKEREKEEKDKKDKERIAAAKAALEKAKLSDKSDSKKEPVDNIPSGAGSWRRTQGAKPGSQQKPPPFRKKSNSEKGYVTSIPGEAGSTGFNKTTKKDGKFTYSKKEPLRKDETSGAPLKSDVKSPTNSFDLLTEVNYNVTYGELMNLGLIILEKKIIINHHLSHPLFHFLKSGRGPIHPVLLMIYKAMHFFSCCAKVR